jgi:hypothetical protein
MLNTKIQLERDLINLISIQKYVCVSQSTISKQSIFINYVNPTKYFLFHCVDIPQSHSRPYNNQGWKFECSWLKSCLFSHTGAEPHLGIRGQLPP